MDALTKNKVRVDALYSIPSFVFVKKGNHPSGIQISISDYEYAINDQWDLLICTEENENLKKIRDKLSDLWNTPGKQFIGSPSDYKIALYVDRKKSNISQTMSTLRLQIEHLNEYLSGPTLIPTSEDLYIKNKDKKEIRKKLSNMIDGIRLSEGLISKRWTVYKSNVRRSIGLYLWDRVNIFNIPQKSRRTHIIELIHKIKSEDPETLNLYLGNFNEYNSDKETTKYGDLAKYQETVIREMDADYYLTDYCIKNHEYLTPYDVKTRG